ncbi:MAG: hypothetical protein HY866_21990 [Chloroflexi bacterium]|nr:hypothetical protein [Chloroflexota bacterium]
MNKRIVTISVCGGMSLLLLGMILVGSAYGYSQINSTPAPFIEPEGCWEPPHDYTRVSVNGMELNARTLAMLDHAQVLYSAQGGIVDFRLALTQGSYTGGTLAASFGTHDGGGAIDLSVLNWQDWSVLTDEIEPMLHALRLAGFAAWLRDTGELYPDSAIHIHAVAVGDYELSPMAREQIDGSYGYLRGSNGLPTLYGIFTPDRYGGPVICGWMIAQGFNDMRGWSNPYPTPGGTTVPRPPMP